MNDELAHNLQIDPYSAWGRPYPNGESPFKLFRDFITWPVRSPLGYLAFEYLWPGRQLKPSVWMGVKSPRIPGVSLLNHFKFFSEKPVLNKVVSFLSGNYGFLGLRRPIAKIAKRHIEDTEIINQILSDIEKDINKVGIKEFANAVDPRDRAAARTRKYIYDTIEKHISPHLKSTTLSELKQDVSKTIRPIFRSATPGMLRILSVVSDIANVVGWAYFAYSISKFVGSTLAYSSRKVLYNLRRSFKLEFGSDISDFLTAIPLSERQRAQRAFSEARMGTSYENYLGNEAAYLYR